MFCISVHAAKVEASQVLTDNQGGQWLAQLVSYHQGSALVYEGIFLECKFSSFGGVGCFTFLPAARRHAETLLTLQNSRRAECHKRAALKQFKSEKAVFEKEQGIILK